MSNRNCNYCSSCSSCNYCNYCNYCDYCDSCNYCRNLKMTECNIFCYSRTFNDDASFQQVRYRAFNTVLTKDRYIQVLDMIKEIIPSNNKLTLSEFWESITQQQWSELLSIPEALDFKEGFEFISSQKIIQTEEMTLEQVCKKLGRNIKIIK